MRGLCVCWWFRHPGSQSTLSGIAQACVTSKNCNVLAHCVGSSKSCASSWTLPTSLVRCSRLAASWVVQLSTCSTVWTDSPQGHAVNCPLSGAGRLFRWNRAVYSPVKANPAMNLNKLEVSARESLAVIVCLFPLGHGDLRIHPFHWARSAFSLSSKLIETCCSSRAVVSGALLTTWVDGGQPARTRAETGIAGCPCHFCGS